MQKIEVGIQAKIGALFFIFWGILHVWVGIEGVQTYLEGLVSQWNLLIGGSKVPLASFQYTTNPATAFAHAHLILNFCIDVAGYGVLGLVVAYLIWIRGSWSAYWIGTIIIGIADLTFLFAMVTSGVIVQNVGTVGGPILWFFAVVITPFGLSRSEGYCLN